ncbi:putative sulfate/molybdate transporter [Limibaculum sp. FT325]|uniref:putative sulfate/molybdate transporter n=1 Tax=Thermohalobaculum sediminis TaxID=2939436 RepID=UPI0020BFF9F6|nr:putative sulfate/molybdate transporter [Limibaculum sediminis]MCL5776889.1 putative sulfate/molybdate transporter [Limibaculum sediminis]
MIRDKEVRELSEGCPDTTRRASILGELNGGIADLGVLLPFTLGLVMAGLVPASGALAGFGIAYLVSAAIYRAPIPVQPMKAIGAVALAGGLASGSLMLSGVAMGVALLLIGLSGTIRRLAYLVPQSVVAGLQLGLGAMLAHHAVSLVLPSVPVGAAAVAFLWLASGAGRLPGALLLVVLSAAVNAAFGAGPSPVAPPPGLTLPALSDLPAALREGVVPQLPLTLTNAVLVTAVLARELFPDRRGRLTERRLCLTSGALNLLLCPMGAVPMCHGAGGLAAHHRFGARSGLGTGLLGAALLALAFAPETAQLAALSLVPLPVLGALLLFGAAELATSRRILDATLSCRIVIAITAVLTFLLDPAVAILIGLVAEAARRVIVRALLAPDDARHRG